MRKTIWFWLCFIVSILLAVYFATRTVMTMLGRGGPSVVRTISIKTDSPDVDLTNIAAAAAVPGGTRVYALNLNALNARVAAVPGVRASAVRRMPNGNLVVKTQMHHAIAQWTDGEFYYPLASDGTIVRAPVDVRDVGALVFRGDVPTDLSDITRAANILADRTDYMEWIEGRRWNLVTMNGTVVKLPENDAAAAIAALVVLDKNHGILSKKLQMIDMRDASRTLVK